VWSSREDVTAVSDNHLVRHVVVMGVSGSGKSTVAARIAERLGRPFGEADLLHPPGNVAKMADGVPLTDEDRRPWLDDVVAWMSERSAGTVVSCSALRRDYRDVLRSAPGRVVFVHLHGPFEVIADRMRRRVGHFMPVTLLRSQFDVLEPLAPDEDGITLDLTAAQDELVEQALRHLGEVR
jgi:gluconokinase